MIRNRFARLLPVALLFATAAAGTAQAATDGTLGATSTGTVTINASVAGRVQISKLSDVTFSAVDPVNPVSNSQNICVWSNTSGRKYNITATGNGTGSAFTLASGLLPTAAYTVEFANTSGAAVTAPLTSGTALTGQSTLATSPTCASGVATSATLVVKMSSAVLQTMQASATYTGVLTLVVAPE
ncbi:MULTISPECIES: hypothetical protein [Sphingomonas]|uniref:hypothetical protein n=1 Tax=Sphingomonas TaxID=13687 RepID=UPI000DEF4CF5|nr:MULTISPECIES: hypothetical protein [Sphingomonas]